ncbi:MAG: DUF4384 domain-containing protein [Desulfobacterales bacterium]|nr:DUF4384 domain-containing protein [Desulfobacterales bacterium]
MLEKKGKCTNFGNCDIADKREEITISEGEEFICTECEKYLTEIVQPTKIPKTLIFVCIGTLVLLGLTGFIAKTFMDPKEPPSGPVIPKQPVQAEQPEITKEEIFAKLEQGEFAEARDLLHLMPENPDVQKFLHEIQTPVKVNIKFQFHKAGGAPSALYPIDSTQIENLSLTHKDNYKLHAVVPETSGNLYLYIFQRDHYDKIHRVFPDPVFSKTDNPVQGGQTYHMPPGEKDWLYLDELSSAETGPITETLYIIATPWKAEDIQELFGKIYKETARDVRSTLVQEFIQRLKLRKDPNINSVFYEEFSFMHGQ